jgi:hypothetical protein
VPPAERPLQQDHAPQQGYPPPNPYAVDSWPGQPVQHDATAALHKARTALGWAVGAAVGAFLAMAVAVVSLLAAGTSGQDDYAYEPMRAEVVGLPAGAALSGDRLEHPLVDLIREQGAESVDLTCPDTASVTVSTTVVCTGDIDGYVWTGVVFFEDTKGTFVVVEV